MSGTAPVTAPQLDSLGRATWARGEVVTAYDPARMSWWSDPGEQGAFAAIAPSARNCAVLDLGVGGGRTTGILRLLTDDYVGVDYTPAMVEVCRRRNPGVDIRLGDVRDLFAVGIENERFAVAVFSYNGLDCLDHPDRQRALAELRRALVDGGLLLFSTHNLDGPAYRPTPWRQAGPIERGRPAYRAGLFLGNLALHPLHLPRSWLNWLRLRSYAVEGDGWGLSVVEGEDFGHVCFFTSLERQIAELDDHGFAVEAVFDTEEGRRLEPGARSRTRSFHLIARKQGSIREDPAGGACARRPVPDRCPAAPG